MRCLCGARRDPPRVLLDETGYARQPSSPHAHGLSRALGVCSRARALPFLTCYARVLCPRAALIWKGYDSIVLRHGVVVYGPRWDFFYIGLHDELRQSAALRDGKSAGQVSKMHFFTFDEWIARFHSSCLHESLVQEHPPTPAEINASVERWRSGVQPRSGSPVHADSGEGTKVHDDWRLCAPKGLPHPPDCRQLFREAAAKNNDVLQDISVRFPKGSEPSRGKVLKILGECYACALESQISLRSA